MANTSATGGVLLPLQVQPPQDLDLSIILQNLVRDVTGLRGDLVRPRWQAQPPSQPKDSETWAAIGEISQTPDSYGFSRMSADGQSMLMRTHWTIDAMLSVYGPSASLICARMAQGMLIEQNREALGLHGVRYVGCGTAMSIPEMINNRWIRRTDLPLQFRRIVDMDYAVLNLLSAPGEVRTADDAQPFNAED